MTGSSDRRQPTRRTVLEPTHVMRRRRPRPLSDFDELFRPDESRPDAHEGGRGEGWERVTTPGTTAAWVPEASQDSEDTDELPRVPSTGHGTEWTAPTARWQRDRKVGVLAALGTAGAAGFGIALLITWSGTGERPQASAPAPAPTASTAPADPGTPAEPVPPASDPGVLQQGDSGPRVSDLQERLLRIPDVYEGGSVSGTYDTSLTEAVGRFQLWYGIRGDETGVYGDDTRRDLESRTGT
ncbi:peptidoglycan-binding protein [Streptomyces sp. NPDC088116]|uniref:peptidoglycan-binding protein n=1 Tax=Streptomyces sp. NPDC088116 TaxID=3365825 RepID=UPI003801FAEB